MIGKYLVALTIHLKYYKYENYSYPFSLFINYKQPQPPSLKPVYTLFKHYCASSSFLTMKPMRRLFKALASRRNPYSIQVKVIEKTNMRTSLESSRPECQMVTLEDEEGTKLKTILYNEELELFDGLIEDEMEYEISNAQVKLIPGQCLDNPDDLVFQIEFNRKTTVPPVLRASCPAQPQYILISSIPRSFSIDDQYDVLGIVIYVGQTYEVPRKNGQYWDAREVILVDQSSEQIMIVTAWGELAIKECNTLQSMATSFPVIGFTALRTSYQKGTSYYQNYASKL
ncbi:replication protein A 70 kDa DNA-binding subunit B-like [Silene latifolia]|uniref:replication protein A 70 kDa DNA-binding subunit B-like n=1 Tax=Silene latifolia TaxID=37657 RepID=UPI003D77441D